MNTDTPFCEAYGCKVCVCGGGVDVGKKSLTYIAVWVQILIFNLFTLGISIFIFVHPIPTHSEIEWSTPNNLSKIL